MNHNHKETMHDLTESPQHQANTTESESPLTALESREWHCQLCTNVVIQVEPFYACGSCRKELQEQLPKKFRNMPDEYRREDIIEKYNHVSGCFVGEPGSGKSTQAAFIMRDILRSGKVATWISVPSLILQLQSNYETAYLLLRSVLNFPGILILDDFWVHNVTPFIQQCLYEIINYRESNRLLTLITTNCTLQQIAEQADDRIASRIVGMCGKQNIVKFSGDLRLEAEQ